MELSQVLTSRLFENHDLFALIERKLMLNKCGAHPSSSFHPNTSHPESGFQTDVLFQFLIDLDHEEKTGKEVRQMKKLFVSPDKEASIGIGWENNWKVCKPHSIANLHK